MIRYMIEEFLRILDSDAYKRDTDIVVFDVGSRDCEQAVEFYRAFPKAKIFAFECNPNTLPKCAKTIEPYADRITLVPKAVHDYTGKCTFYPINQKKTITTWVDGNPGASSLFQSNGKYPIETYIQDQIEVPCTTLEAAMAEHGIAAANLIWMDLQGAELLALRGLGDKLSSVDYIYTEVSHRPMYTGQVLFSELDEFLTTRGFERISEIRADGRWQENVAYRRRGRN